MSTPEWSVLDCVMKREFPFLFQEQYIIDLAKHFKYEKDVIIAKIDGTANEGPKQYPASGFPTIYYAKPGRKNQPIKLTGQRDYNALVKFVEDNSDIIKKKASKEEL